MNSPDENGITPLAKSVLIGDQRIVQMLLSKGADANIGKIFRGHNLDYARHSKSHGIVTNHKLLNT